MNNRRLLRLKTEIKKIITLIICCSLFVVSTGCEAFVKKFTRTSKREKAKEEIVLTPQEYSLSDLPVEERYRQSFLFWKSWHDELIAALASSNSYKKKNDSLEEAINNLKEIRVFLFQEKQNELDSYLQKLKQLGEDISKDIYGKRIVEHKSKAESLKRDILRAFSFPNVKNHLR
ncbi:MAG: hypothetical protein ABH914_01130 [Candidatus Omnitrophota bacterium]